jgi:hypothetical protein
MTSGAEIVRHFIDARVERTVEMYPILPQIDRH